MLSRDILRGCHLAPSDWLIVSHQHKLIVLVRLLRGNFFDHIYNPINMSTYLRSLLMDGTYTYD